MHSGKVLLLGLLAICCAIPAMAQEARGRVIGGGTVISGDWPYMVSLHASSCLDGDDCTPAYTSAMDSLFCGGTLIDARWVLTAAHCLLGFSAPEQILVHIGDQPRDQVSSDEAIVVDAAWLHHAFVSGNDQNGTFYPNDIALLRLSVPAFPLTANLASRRQTDDLTAGQPVEVLGWGDTDPTGAGVFPPDLQQAELALQSCDEYTVNGFNREFQLCAAGEGRDACRGDSGGPLLVQEGRTWYQVGIVSWGLVDEVFQCANQYPGFYTRIARYDDWIAKVRGGDIASTLPDASEEQPRSWLKGATGGAGANQPLALLLLTLLAWRSRRL